MVTKIEQFQDYLARLYPTFKVSKNGVKRLTRTVTFQVTDACNLACSYCYQINKATHVMSFDTAKRFIDMLLSATASDNSYINPDISDGIIIEFIGGEPLLEIELINKITDYFISKMFEMHHKWATKFMISMCSNGVLYFEPKVQAYIKKHFSHFSFSISIDGNKALHDACRVFPNGNGSYDIAIKAVRHFVDVLGGRMGSKMTLCPANIEKTFEAVKSLLEFPYKQIFLNCVYEDGWTALDGRTLYFELKKVADYVIRNGLFDNVYLSIFESEFFRKMDENENENWCGGTGSMLACDYKGDLFPCIRYMESSLGSKIKPIIIGDVYEGLMNTAAQKEEVGCMQCITRRSQSSDECFNCPIGSGCSWCSAYNYQVFGTQNKRATFICIMHKARALANAYFWNLGYIKTGSDKRFKMNIPTEWASEIIDNSEFEMLKNLERGILC